MKFDIVQVLEHFSDASGEFCNGLCLASAIPRLGSGSFTLRIKQKKNE